MLGRVPGSWQEQAGALSLARSLTHSVRKVLSCIYHILYC